MPRRYSAWFKAKTQQPIRTGLYEIKLGKAARSRKERNAQVRAEGGIRVNFRLWDGSAWFLVNESRLSKGDADPGFGSGPYQYWRGLTSEEYDRRRQ